MARFYSNENFPIPVVVELRNLGHDVLTIQEQGRASESVPDPEVLAFAVAQERAVLTFNRRDFMRLHRLSADHFGIVVCTEDPDHVSLAHRIHLAVEGTTDLRGLLIRVVRPQK